MSANKEELTVPVKWFRLDETEMMRKLVQHIYGDAPAYLASRLRALTLAKATGNSMASRVGREVLSFTFRELVDDIVAVVEDGPSIGGCEDEYIKLG